MRWSFFFPLRNFLELAVHDHKVDDESSEGPGPMARFQGLILPHGETNMDLFA